MTEDQIKILGSAQATHDAILQALDYWLVAGTGPGDRVILYYSGHGSQTLDDDGDEEDGWDEVLCPVDYNPVTQANTLRDDRLGEALRKLEGRNITVILDACHSGTAYKAIGAQLYADPVYPTDNVIPKFVPRPNQRRATGSGETIVQGRGAPLPTAGSMIDGITHNQVVFSACTDSQRAEVATFFAGGRLLRRSVFTRALLRGLAGRADRNRDAQITNAEVFDYVTRELSRPGWDFTQTPELTCSDLYRQQRVFARTLTLAGPARLFYEDGKQAAINRGQYHDVQIGDRFVLVPEGGPSEDRGEVLVTRVEKFLSFGTLSKDIVFRPPGVEVRPIVRLRPFDKLRVFFGRFRDPVGDPVDVPVVLRAAAVGTSRILIVSDQAECDRIVSGTVEPDGTLHVFIYGRFGRLRSQFSASRLEGGRELVRRLRGQAFLEELAACDNPAPPFHVDLSVKGGRRRFLIFPSGDRRPEKIELIVTAEQDCYIVLLSIDSRGRVRLLLPNRWQQDTKITAGRLYTIPPPGAGFIFGVQLPPGHDDIKAIATRRPFDLSHVNAKGLTEQGFIQFDERQRNDLIEDIRARGIGVQAAPSQKPGTGQELWPPGNEWATSTLTIETLLPQSPADGS